VAILGVGNKGVTYNELDVRQLILLMQAMWRLIQRKRAEKSLRESEEKHRIVLESVPDPVAVYDLKGKITYLNPSFTRLFGWSIAKPIAQTSDFVPVEKLSQAELIVEKINHGKTVSGVETCRLTKDGQMIDVSISGAGFFDSSGKLRGYVLTFQDISDRKKNEEEIRFLAFHDVLTKLPNRKAFYERLEDMVSQERYRIKGDRRTSQLKKWGLLFLDLDRFKYVNDTLGHDVGDELLKAVAERLRSCLRQTDHIFRLGGDEFTVIVNNLTDPIEGADISRKIQEEISRPYRLQDHELYITVSIGISLCPDDGEDVETLVKNADMAMYAAKEDGGGYHFFTEEMNKKAQERMQLESGLRHAIQHNQFLLHYQPLVNTENQIVGMEALLRWNHPQKGMISPGQFIPLAEETGAIVPIGEWVLYTACQQLKKWHDAGHKKLYMSVNVSTRQFREANFVELVERVIKSTKLNPEYLTLEVTESSIMDKPEEAIAKMQTLRAQGIHFAIDDFGTGYSSLSYMKRFPIDTLKIDRSFVADSLTNRDDQEIIKTILSMAQHLHIETIAEGVETKEQKEFLCREGCQMMQGFYFSRPMPVTEFEEKLKITALT
jgi:diguanylate cyclase (GGDEF)-like protein/PAS domain S-box-containing protein